MDEVYNGTKTDYLGGTKITSAVIPNGSLVMISYKNYEDTHSDMYKFFLLKTDKYIGLHDSVSVNIINGAVRVFTAIISLGSDGYLYGHSSIMTPSEDGPQFGDADCFITSVKILQIGA